MFRLCTPSILTLTSLTFAAPVPIDLPKPKSNISVILVTIKGDNTTFELTTPVQVPVTKTGTRVVQIMGKDVTETYTYTADETVMQSQQVDLKNFELYAQNGKEISPDTFVKKMKAGVPTVYVQTIEKLDPEWRKLFADDVVFMLPLPPKK